ncbi:GNAT family N-acetyltransferase [Oceanirhabdus sp. W0125-5]|uniref:GNAT family N-acetyltransferase n=1 Tax=Oceanirhabdus sp. W0125-5 TaxID=2999116 RepID=UPI0022F2C883|nr:GNAT family N-acetyltransferase [Oceanirhabdus sp. W0125-5]WBW97882.1 GNAT family N-acetyltransferase [Oceanirhabdus sp. W0125-5]
MSNASGYGIETSLNDMFINFPYIMLKEFSLEPLTELHVNDLHEIYSDKENSQYVTHHHMATIDETLDYIKRITNRYEKREQLRWGIIEKNSEKLIGLISLHTIDLTKNTAQLGYVLNKKYYRKGITSLCLNEIINFIYKNTEIEHLEASISPENKPSIALVTKLGFKKYRIRLGYSYNKSTGEYENRFFYRLSNCK